MRNSSLSYSPALLLLTMAVAVPARAGVSDLKADWSEISNPNGAWTLLEPSGLLQHMAQIPHPISQPQPVWIGASQYLPFVMRIEPVNVGYLPDWVAGDIHVHPDNAGTPVTLRWTSSVDAIADISGSVFYATETLGRAQHWGVSVNGNMVTVGYVYEGDAWDRTNPMSLSDGSAGGAGLHNLAVGVGDTIDLVIWKAPASPYGGNVGVEFTITTVAVPEARTYATTFTLGLLVFAGMRRLCTESTSRPG